MKRGRGWEEGVVAATAAHAAAAPAIPTPPAPASFDSLVPVSSVSRSLVRAHPHPLGCTDSHSAMFIPAYPCLSPHHAHLAAAWPLFVLIQFACTRFLGRSFARSWSSPPARLRQFPLGRVHLCPSMLVPMSRPFGRRLASVLVRLHVRSRRSFTPARFRPSFGLVWARLGYGGAPCMLSSLSFIDRKSVV